MKHKPLLKITAFCLLLLVLNGGMSIFYDKLMRNESAILKIEDQFNRSSSHIKYLCIGDSHLQNGFDPREIPESFNFSNTSICYYHIYYRLKYLFENRVKTIDTLILPLDLHSFSPAYYDVVSNSWYWVKYVNYAELGKQRGTPLPTFIDWFKGTYMPYFQRKDVFFWLMDPNRENSFFIGGFVPKKTTLEHPHMVKSAKIRSDFHFKGRRIPDKAILGYFWRTLELCKHYNVKVILVRTPVTKEYFDLSLQYLKQDPFYKIKSILKSKYPDVTFIDLADVFFNNETFFENSDHLNIDGAIAFSRILKDKLPGHSDLADTPQ